MIPPENARQRQARERKAQLREQALELFGTRGVEATSMKDLASAAGVTPGLLYHYFDSKEALLADVFAHYGFAPELRTIVAHADGAPVGTVLGTVGDRFTTLLRERASLVRVLVREALVHPAVAKQFATIIGEGISTLTGFLEERIAAGELRPHDASITARSLMFTLLQQHLMLGDEDDFTNRVVEALLGGIVSPLQPGERKE